ncbi:hypothetical protein BCR35DRAFT_304037 [Leucosporidium creatinivorum]|uniref:RRM domain-containing protein n=1 Tax=Leucosporidium creatinivorum TaxID=106004 RepID=A0A1Y2FEL4_9BASI|nr:hypothetical protein BCR35DRAFT_304037 [Leucosporidium creatinivorum]
MLCRTTRAAVRLGCRARPLASLAHQAETSSSALAVGRGTKALLWASPARSLYTSPCLRTEDSATSSAPPAPTPSEPAPEIEETTTAAPSSSPAAPSPTAAQTPPTDPVYSRRVKIRNVDPAVTETAVKELVADALGGESFVRDARIVRRTDESVHAVVDFKQPEHAAQLIALAPTMGDVSPTYEYDQPTVKSNPRSIPRDPCQVAVVGLPPGVPEDKIRRVAEQTAGGEVVGKIIIAKKRHPQTDLSTSRIAFVRFNTPAEAQRLLQLAPSVSGANPQYRLAQLGGGVRKPALNASADASPPPSSPSSAGPRSSVSTATRSKSNDPKFSTKSNTDQSAEDRPRGIFVGGLDTAITSGVLREAVTRALQGPSQDVVNARVAVDRVGKSKGFGFVELRNSTLINRLLPLAPKLLDSCPNLTLTRARPSPKPFAALDFASAPQNPPSTRLWVGNLPPLITDTLLHQAFGRVGGRVRRITLVEEKDRRSKEQRTSAYVTMQTTTEAQRVIEFARSEKGMRVAGASLLVGFASSRPGKGERKEGKAEGTWTPKPGVVVSREVKGKTVGAPRVKAKRELPIELQEPPRLPRMSREEREQARPRRIPEGSEEGGVASHALANLFRKM